MIATVTKIVVFFLLYDMDRIMYEFSLQQNLEHWYLLPSCDISEWLSKITTLISPLVF